MRERGAERRRMRRQRERAVGTHAQALLLDAAADCAERFAAKRAQALIEMDHLYKGIRHRRRPSPTA
ncbi:hypothetical protein D3C83_225280 [compost metagenome]